MFWEKGRHATACAAARKIVSSFAENTSSVLAPSAPAS